MLNIRFAIRFLSYLFLFLFFVVQHCVVNFYTKKNKKKKTSKQCKSIVGEKSVRKKLEKTHVFWIVLMKL